MKSCPLYWFEDYWLQHIYIGGVEETIRRHAIELPIKISDYCGEKEEGHVDLFFWKPAFNTTRAQRNVPAVVQKGYTLFAKKDVDGEHCPVLFVDGAKGDSEMRLYAGKKFGVGDAITFFSQFEESTGKFVLGGSFARIGETLSECNATLMESRVLRCLKPIKYGDEIVLYKTEKPAKDHYYHLIDRVVVNPTKMMLGRVGLEILRDESSMLVYYPDSSTETLDFAKNFGFVYRENRD